MFSEENSSGSDEKVPMKSQQETVRAKPVRRLIAGNSPRFPR
jgi:hypothetical protein